MLTWGQRGVRQGNGSLRTSLKNEVRVGEWCAQGHRVSPRWLLDHRALFLHRLPSVILSVLRWGSQASAGKEHPHTG